MIDQDCTSIHSTQNNLWTVAHHSPACDNS